MLAPEPEAPRLATGGIFPSSSARFSEGGCDHVVPGHRGEVERTLYAGEIVLHLDDPRLST